MFFGMTASLQEEQHARIAPAPAQATPIVLVLKEVNGRGADWSLTLHPAHLALADSPGAQPYVIMREQMMKTATLMEGLNVLGLTRPIKATFKLIPEATAALAEWIGKPALAASYLKRRYAWVLPIAIIWILGSLPLPGNSSAGVQAIPFDPIGLALGVTLVVSWAFARWRPHPALFLVDSLWFVAMGGQLVMDVIQGRSKGWLVLVVLLVWMIVTGLKHFFRFRGTTIPRPGGSWT